jgi:AbiV family abortive infection protein
MSSLDYAAKPRSERLLKLRAICCEHASDLIESAERILKGERPIPNIAFHLTLLAIEEIGKASLITAREVSVGERDIAWINKHMEDHAKKLLHGLWSPPMRVSKEINPERFRQLQEFSKQAHQQRLAALYVDVASDDALASPKDAVTVEETESLLEIAKQNLQLLASEPARDVDTQDELMRWFQEAVSDEQMQERLFSQSFLAKIDELNGNIPEWTSWAKAEFEKIDSKEKALMEAEASRFVDKSIAPKERWRLKLRIFCVSHSIRQRMLNIWNESVPLAKLYFVSSEEMLLELTLGDWNTGKDVVVSAQAFSKIFLAALNIGTVGIGTVGFFWHEMPKKSADYFVSMEDLENPKMRLTTTGGFDLQRQWRTGENGRKLTVLEETHLKNAAQCAVVFIRMKEEEAQPIFAPYLQGLATLGKSDAFMSLDVQTINAFNTALGNALTHYGDWDGKSETLILTLHRVFADMIPEEEHRELIFKHFKEPAKTMQELQEHAISAKRVVDLYLTWRAHQQWRKLSCPETPSAPPSN